MYYVLCISHKIVGYMPDFSEVYSILNIWSWFKFLNR